MSDKTRGNGLKLHLWRFRLYIRKKIVNFLLAKPWKKLPRVLADSPSLEVFE